MTITPSRFLQCLHPEMSGPFVCVHTDGGHIYDAWLPIDGELLPEVHHVREVVLVWGVASDKLRYFQKREYKISILGNGLTKRVRK